MQNTVAEKLTPKQRELRENLGNPDWWEKRWHEDRDSVCRDLMALYNVTGCETREIISEEIASIKRSITSSFDSLADTIKKLEKENASIKLQRKEDRRQTDKNTAEVVALKGTLSHLAYDNAKMKGELKSTSETAKAIQADVRILVAALIKPGGAKPTSFAAKIPFQAWAALSLALVAAGVYLLTGDASFLTEFLSPN